MELSEYVQKQLTDFEKTFIRNNKYQPTFLFRNNIKLDDAITQLRKMLPAGTKISITNFQKEGQIMTSLFVDKELPTFEKFQYNGKTYLVKCKSQLLGGAVYLSRISFYYELERIEKRLTVVAPEINNFTVDIL